MFPPTMSAEEKIRTAWAAHGMSVVELRRRHAGEPWTYERTGRLNRRITLDTVFTVDGPAAGSPLLQTAAGPDRHPRPRHHEQLRRRHDAVGHRAVGRGELQPVLLRRRHLRRGEALRPRRPGRRAVAHRRRALGRGARTRTSRTASAGSSRSTPRTRAPPRSSTPRWAASSTRAPTSSSTATARSWPTWATTSASTTSTASSPATPTAPAAPSGTARTTRPCCPHGDLSVARFTGDGLEDGVSDGTGEWLPLTVDGESVVPGMTTEQVLVYTRLAADKVQPTKMDRPEDVEPNYVNGFIYVACTNNTDRGKVGKEGPTEPNPRNANKDGHVVEMMPTGGDHTAADVRVEPLPHLRRRGLRGRLLRRVDRTGVADLLPRQRRLRLGRQPVGLHRRPAERDQEVRRPLQGAGRRCRSAAGCSSSSPCPPAPRPAARSSTTATARSSWPCSTRARTARGPPSSPTSPTSWAPAAPRAPGQFAGPRPTVVQVTRR